MNNGYTYTIEDAIDAVNDYIAEASTGDIKERMMNAYNSVVNKPKENKPNTKPVNNNNIGNASILQDPNVNAEVDEILKDARKARAQKTARAALHAVTAGAVIGGGAYLINTTAKGKQAAAINNVSKKIVHQNERKNQYRDRYKKKYDAAKETAKKETRALKRQLMANKKPNESFSKADQEKIDKFVAKKKGELSEMKSRFNRANDIIDQKIAVLNDERERYKNDKYAALKADTGSKIKGAAEQLTRVTKAVKLPKKVIRPAK